MTGRVTGIGGIFFRSSDPAGLSAWYNKQFGIADPMAGPPWQAEAGGTVFAPFVEDSDYFRADRRFMINLRVDGIEALVKGLTASGVTVKWLPDEGYGRFAHLEDPEGNPIELWEPPGS